MATYADVPDIIAWLDLDNENEADQLEECLEAASRAIDAFCGWSFDLATSTAARVYIPRSCGMVVTDPFTETDLDDVTVLADVGGNGSFSKTCVAGVEYQAEPLNAMRSGVTFPYHKLRAIRAWQWPTSRDLATVKVTATFGWPAVPGPVKTACLLEASRLHMRRRGIEGVVGFEGGGVARVGLEIDKDAAAKLAPYTSPTKMAGLRG